MAVSYDRAPMFQLLSVPSIGHSKEGQLKTNWDVLPFLLYIAFRCLTSYFEVTRIEKFKNSSEYRRMALQGLGLIEHDEVQKRNFKVGYCSICELHKDVSCNKKVCLSAIRLRDFPKEI